MTALMGKVVWVTGAGSGIGRAIAVAFGRERARLAITGRTPDALEETAGLVTAVGGTAQIVAADVADPAQVAAAHRAVVDGLGDPDILVNNAGTNIAARHWAELQPDEMGRLVDVNLKGPFHCTLAVLPAMRARRSGTIIHVASVAALSVFPGSGPAYIASKHGARALSASLNADEGIHGIRSVCINPGEVETPIMDKRPVPPDAAARALMAQPEDIAAAAVFAALLPARTCITDLTITPTDNAFWREGAERIAHEGANRTAAARRN